MAHHGVISVTFSSKIQNIIGFLLNSFIRLNNTSLKDNLLTISNVQTAWFYHKSSKSFVNSCI